VSLALTSGLMIWLGVSHPPAGATTLIVGLGILHKPEQLLILMLAVVVLVAEGVIVNRVFGVEYPVWAKREAAGSTG
jgi:CBS domain-containing membrane protein